MAERTLSRVATVTWVYLIIALFIALILGLVLLFRFQMDASEAMRVYAGGEGLWAKAQKDAVNSLEQYIVSHDEADYQSYRRWIQVPLGDQQARLALQQAQPDAETARAGFLQGRLNPEDIEYAIQIFLRFQHIPQMARVIEHWIQADRHITELVKVAEALHDEIASGHASPQSLRAMHARLQAINREVTQEEDQFSFTLAEASRWLNDISRKFAYTITALFAALGIALSWPIIARIRTTESGLQESEQKFRSITTSAFDAIAMIDDAGKTVFFNEAAEKMFGYSAAEVIGKEMHLLLAAPRFLEAYRQAYHRFALSGEGAAVGKVVELVAQRRDGGEFPIELSLSAMRIKGRWHAVGIIRDISGRKTAETALAESEKKLRTILESLQTGVVIIDPETHKITYVNSVAARMIGAPKEKIIDATCHQFICPAEWGKCPITDLHQTVDNSERVLLTAKGERCPIIKTVTTIVLGGKEFLLESFIDISARKQAEEKIRKLNEALEAKVEERSQQLLAAQDELVHKERLAVLGQVAGSIGHELRNPLGVMSNAVFFLQTVLPDADATTREYLNIISKEIAGSERIVSDLLDAVRTRPPNPKAVAVAELVDQALGDSGIPASVHVRLDIPPAISALRVDSQQIHMALRKLIYNSVEAMPQGGALEITAREDTQAKRITVSVKDRGIGMTPEQLGKLFQPLFTTKARGIGLGLVVVKNLVEINGGTVQVASEAGKGTVFAITLPAADERGILI